MACIWCVLTLVEVLPVWPPSQLHHPQGVLPGQVYLVGNLDIHDKFTKTRIDIVNVPSTSLSSEASSSSSPPDVREGGGEGDLEGGGGKD